MKFSPFFLRTLLGTLLSILLYPALLLSTAIAAPQEAVETLTNLPAYYKTAKPDQVRKWVHGVSLKGVAVLNEKKEGITPLMRAALETPYGEVIDILVKAGVDVNAVTQPLSANWHDRKYGYEEDAQNRSALHFAVRNPNPAALKALLKYRPNLNEVTGQRSRYTSLELAMEMPDRYAHFALLWNAGARPDCSSATWVSNLWNLFIRTTESGKDPVVTLPKTPPDAAVKIAQVLLSAGCKPDQSILRTALHSGHSEVAMLLIKAGVNPASTHHISGYTMLHEALYRPRRAYSTRIDIPDPDPVLIRELAKHNNVNARTKAGNTALDIASNSGMGLPVIRALLEAGAKLDASGNDLLFNTLLSGRDNPELVAFLLQKGFSATYKGRRGETPLRAASRVPRKPKSAVVLVRAGANPNDLSDVLDRTFAVEAGILDKNGNILISSSSYQKKQDNKETEGLDVAAILSTGRADPKEAVFNGNFYRVATPDQVREIVGKQSLAGIRTVKEDYKLSRSGPGFPGIVGFISLLGALKTHTREHQSTPLMIAAATTPYPEVIDILVQAGGNVRDLNSVALIFSLRNPNPAILAAVLKHKPEIQTIMYDSGTSLHYLAWVQEASIEHLRILLAAKPQLNAQDEEGETALMRAARWRKPDRARMLMKAGADLNIANKRGKRALSYAIEAGEYTLAKEMIAAGAEMVYGNKKGTLLDKAVEQGKIDPVLMQKLVAAYGATSETARDAAYEAAKKGNAEALKGLLDNGVRLPEGNNNLLMYAVLNNNSKDVPGLVTYLLKKGADPNSQYNDGMPVLSKAARDMQPESVAVLIKAGARLNAQNRDNGNTALVDVLASNFGVNHRSSTRFDPERQRIISLLIAAKADVNKENKKGLSPLLFSLDKPDSLRLLLKAGGKVNTVTGSGWTALTLAASDDAFANAIPLLLAAGANPRQKNKDGLTPMELARKNKNGKAIAILEKAVK